MNTKVRNSGLIVILFGVIALAMGIVFVQQGFDKVAWLVQNINFAINVSTASRVFEDIFSIVKFSARI